MHTHLIGNDPCQGGLSQSRRAVKQHMIQGVPSLFCRFDIDFQIAFRLFLANIVFQILRTETSLCADIFFHHICSNNSSFHVFLPNCPRTAFFCLCLSDPSEHI